MSGTALRQCRGAWAWERLLKLERALAGQEGPEQKGTINKKTKEGNDCGSRADWCGCSCNCGGSWQLRRRPRVWNLNPADWCQGGRDARRGGVGCAVRVRYRRGGLQEESKASKRLTGGWQKEKQASCWPESCRNSPTEGGGHRLRRRRVVVMWTGCDRIVVENDSSKAVGAAAARMTESKSWSWSPSFSLSTQVARVVAGGPSCRIVFFPRSPAVPKVPGRQARLGPVINSSSHEQRED